MSAGLKNSICGCTVSIVLWALGAIGAETIVLTSPSKDMAAGEGDEFATHVVGNRWDMNELRDIPLDYLFRQPSVLDGIWHGTYAHDGALIYLLNRGFSTADYGTYPSLYDNGIPYGPLNPIDAGKYRRLSIRMGMNQDERSSILFFWQKTLGQVENNYYAFVDADFNRTIKCPYATGFRIYDIDMANDTFLNDRNPELFSLTSKVGTWDGRILGLFAILTGSGHAGTQVQVDWARLYDPSASDVLTVAWTTAGLLQCDPKYYTVQLWVDTDNSGHDGDLYITGLKNDGSYDVFLSSLPPGDYYFYLKLILQGDREFFTVATSGYSARVRVNAAPSLRLDAPSMTSGDDYAAAARGSAWDMADASGIAGVYDVTNIAYAGGLEPLVLHAFNARRRDCRLRTAALRVAANTMPGVALLREAGSAALPPVAPQPPATFAKTLRRPRGLGRLVGPEAVRHVQFLTRFRTLQGTAVVKPCFGCPDLEASRDHRNPGFTTSRTCWRSRVVASAHRRFDRLTTGKLRAGRLLRPPDHPRA